MLDLCESFSEITLSVDPRFLAYNRRAGGIFFQHSLLDSWRVGALCNMRTSQGSHDICL